jgi:hypothetical protein
LAASDLGAYMGGVCRRRHDQVAAWASEGKRPRPAPDKGGASGDAGRRGKHEHSVLFVACRRDGEERVKWNDGRGVLT